MSKLLAELLAQPERLVTKSINNLEATVGYTSEDARLIGDSKQLLRKKISELKLDPDDTTGPELFHALASKYARDCSLIDKALGINDETSIEKKVNKAAELLRHGNLLPDMWVLKQATAKKLLRDLPPKRLMKQLNYRSVESLLKHEDSGQILLSADAVETAAWHRDLNRKVTKLPATDFESRTAQIALLPSHDDSSDFSVVASRLAGLIGVHSSENIASGHVLTLVLSLVDAIEGLTHNLNAFKLSHICPAVLWWEQSEFLVAKCGEDVISLNYRDFAASSVGDNNFAARELKNGRQSLWGKLLERYQNGGLGSLQPVLVTDEEPVAQDEPQAVPQELVDEFSETFAL